MQVSVRKSQCRDAQPPKVVLEVVMTVDEAHSLNLANPSLSSAIGSCIAEHTKTRFRVSRQVEVIRG